MSFSEVSDILTSQRYHSMKLYHCIISQNASGLTGFQHTMLWYRNDGWCVECSYHHYLSRILRKQPFFCILFHHAKPSHVQFSFNFTSLSHRKAHTQALICLYLHAVQLVCFHLRCLMWVGEIWGKVNVPRSRALWTDLPFPAAAECSRCQMLPRTGGEWRTRWL